MNYQSTPWVPVKGPKRYFTSAPGVQRCNTQPRPETTGQRLKRLALVLAPAAAGAANPSRLALRRLCDAALAYDDRPHI